MFVFPGPQLWAQESSDMSPEELKQFGELLIEKYRDCWSNRRADCLLQLYTPDAEIYRTKVAKGKEVGRSFYHGHKDILAGKLSKTYLRTGSIRINFTDLEALYRGGRIYILFEQTFSNFSPEGKLVYRDEVLKFIVMRSVKGIWAVDFEDSMAFSADDYLQKRQEAKERFLPKFGESKEEKFEAIPIKQEPEEPFKGASGPGFPTPTPSPSSIPSPTPTPTPAPTPTPTPAPTDRTSVGSGKSVDLGGRRHIKKKKNNSHIRR